MVALNMLWKLCLVVAFWFSATATSTDATQDQPKKESLVSRFFGKKDDHDTKTHEVPGPTKIDTQKHNETGHPKYDVEWYLLPKPLNRFFLSRCHLFSPCVCHMTVMNQYCPQWEKS